MNPEPDFIDHMLERWYDACVEEFYNAVRSYLKNQDKETVSEMCDMIATVNLHCEEGVGFYEKNRLHEGHTICWLFHQYHNVYGWDKVRDEFNKQWDERRLDAYDF